MANKHSYEITRSNNRTEKEGIEYILSTDSRFERVDRNNRKAIMVAFNLDKKFSRAFDLIMLPKRHLRKGKSFKINPKTAVLVELKTTKKKLLDNPKGFFFGVTENEYALGRKLGKNFRFCFVSLHPESAPPKFLTYDQLKSRKLHERKQYQVNIKD